MGAAALGRIAPAVVVAGVMLPLGRAPVVVRPGPPGPVLVPVGLAPVRVTVRVTLPAFSDTWTADAANVTLPATSSSVMVPTPCPSARVAPVGAPRLTARVSGA